MKSALKNKAGLKDLRGHLDWLLLILILLFLFVSIILVPTLLTVTGLEDVPFALHSVLSADYSVDDLALKYSQVKGDIIAQVIADQYGLWLGDNSGEIALSQPIAIATPYPGLPGTPTVDLLHPSATPEPNDGIGSPTEPNYVASPTDGINTAPTDPAATHKPPNTTMVATYISPSRTSTLLPSTTRTPNSTSITSTKTVSPATQTPGSTSIAPTRTSAPTSTLLPPTHTPTPNQPPSTNTPRPTLPPPTNTPPPTQPLPTNTPRPTLPPPTNTPRPTRPPDPYPPPPSPQPTPYP